MKSKPQIIRNDFKKWHFLKLKCVNYEKKNGKEKVYAIDLNQLEAVMKQK